MAVQKIMGLILVQVAEIDTSQGFCFLFRMQVLGIFAANFRLENRPY